MYGENTARAIRPSSHPSNWLNSGKMLKLRTQYVDYGDATKGTCLSDIDLCTTGFTVSFWVKPYNQLNIIFINTGSGDFNNQLGLKIWFYPFYGSGGTLNFKIHAKGRQWRIDHLIDNPAIIPSSEWSMGTLVFDKVAGLYTYP